MKNFKSYLKEIQAIRKDSLNNYEYTYFNKTNNGMEYSVDVNRYFGTDRAGYEKFKQENPDSYVDHPTTSLRSVVDRISGKTVGFITEKTLSSTPMRDEAKRLFDLQLEEVIRYLEVKDLDSFMYYIDEKTTTFDFNDSVEIYRNKLSSLIDIIDEYENDEEFRKYLNKIKG
jgi:hypothetical protein